ncbi:hypothetical protein ACFL59_04710 [Planctomycetota bacterium]
MVVVVVVALAGLSEAGTVHMANGDVVRGEIVDLDAEYVTVLVKSGSSAGRTRIRLSEVSDILLDSGQSIFKKDISELIKRVQPKSAAPGEGGQQTSKSQSEDEDPGKQADKVFVEFSGTYSDMLHGFRLSYPNKWGKPKPLAMNYLVFQDPRAGGFWSFNVTIFERFETTFADLAKTAKGELKSHSEYRVLSRSNWASKRGDLNGERTRGWITGDDRTIRHEQLIVETDTGILLMLNLFSASAGEGPVPEFEAVIRSLATARRR